MLYAEDSFFTLGSGGRIGLVALSVLLAAGAIWLVWWASDGLKRVWRVLIGLAVFWAFVWLSPQVYYLYYIAIFDGLPWQNVVKTPPGPGDIARILSFTDRANLSAHGQGVLGWALMLAGLLRRRKA
jgi:hypothetical protein